MKKNVRRLLKILLVLVVLILLTGIIAVQFLKPDYNGTRTLADLRDSVQVDYDGFGIPHIRAQSEMDAARALGYVHAQDRLWQMELLRRVARGGLSEVFGAELLDTDRFFLTLGIDQASREVVSGLDPETPSARLAQAYLDGINAFVETGPTPIEFYLTGLEKSAFAMEDVYNAMGYMAFSFAMAHKTDPFLDAVSRELGPEYLRELLDEPPGATEVIPVYDVRSSQEAGLSVRSRIGELMKTLPVPLLEGSNSWVIGPSKTRSGDVLFANDPHIGFAQPSVWYEAHMNTPGYEKYGYYMAGIPFPLLAHDRKVAYGMTMFENDDLDFYLEEVDSSDSTRYRRPGGWKQFEVVQKEIPVKGSDPVKYSFLKSDLGPVVNSVVPGLGDLPPVSVSWVYTSGPNRVLDALYGISHATDLNNFEAAVRMIHAPGLNIMYGDSEGNVAWWAAARLYRLPDSVRSKTLLPGPLADSIFSKPVGFSANPKSVNPPSGYVYSANNQPDSTSAGYIPGYYLPENRARRIAGLLDTRDDWDRAGVLAMLTDVVSPVDAEIVRNLSRYVDVRILNKSQTECVDAINQWDGSYPLDGQEALLYQRWVYYFLYNTFADELGPEGFASLMDTHLVKRLIAPMSRKESSVWWDDVNTEGIVETKADIVSKSFRQGVSSVEADFGGDSDNWRWSRVHTLEMKHPMGQVAILRPLLNVGPFPVPGTREVINNMAFDYDSTGQYPVTSGPSTRRVIDFSAIDSSLSILPTGQSGNPFSPHYDDQAEMFIRGEFRPMLMDPAMIREGVKNTLLLLPE